MLFPVSGYLLDVKLKSRHMTARALSAVTRGPGTFLQCGHPQESSGAPLSTSSSFLSGFFVLFCFVLFPLQHLISERNHLKVLLKNMVWGWAGRDYDEINEGLWGWRSWAPPGGPGPGAALLLPGGPVATAHLLAGVR